MSFNDQDKALQQIKRMREEQAQRSRTIQHFREALKQQSDQGHNVKSLVRQNSIAVFTDRSPKAASSLRLLPSDRSGCPPMSSSTFRRSSSDYSKSSVGLSSSVKSRWSYLNVFTQCMCTCTCAHIYMLCTFNPYLSRSLYISICTHFSFRPSLVPSLSIYICGYMGFLWFRALNTFVKNYHAFRYQSSQLKWPSLKEEFKVINFKRSLKWPQK